MSYAIRVESVGKQYRLGVTHAGSIRELVNRGWKRMIGRKEALLPHEEAQLRGISALDGDTFWALKDVAFDVKPGEVVGIIGRNGSGKSTLLKILSQITAPTTGRIELRGRVASLLEVGTGFHPELSGRENVYLNGAILGMTKPEIRRKFDEIVAFAEIEKFIDTPVKRYSSGMYVRLAFAVAAHLEPEILLVDEVLSVGDLAFQKKCLGKMNELSHSQGRTVLFVTHNMALVHNLCRTAIHLSQGCLEGVGMTGQILTDYMSSDTNRAVGAGEKGLPLVAPEIRITDFFSCDQSAKRSHLFRTSDPICFATCYEIDRVIPGLRIGIDLVNSATGEVLFRTFDDDMVARFRKVGASTAHCVIPRNLFKPGSYVAGLLVGIHNVKWITQSKIQQTIQVEHLDGVNSSYADGRPGVIMPATLWNVEHSN